MAEVTQLRTERNENQDKESKDSGHAKEMDMDVKINELINKREEIEKNLESANRKVGELNAKNKENEDVIVSLRDKEEALKSEVVGLKHQCEDTPRKLG